MGTEDNRSMGQSGVSTMRVVHVIHSIGDIGGAQTYVREVAGLLRTAGHTVAILHGDEAPAELDGVTTRRGATLEHGSSWWAEIDPDVLHVHDRGLPRDNSFPPDVPVVRSFHNYGFACSAGTKYFRDGVVCARAHGPGCFIAAVVKGCPHRFDPRPFLANYSHVSPSLRNLRTTRGVIVHSEFVRSVAIANGFSADRCHLVPFFVERPAVPPARASTATVVFVGRIVPDKGLDVLLRALALVTDDWERLLVAGDGWSRQECERLAHRLGLSERVRFLGEVDGDELREVLLEARVVAVPSRWPEPFGIVGLEAMAQSRPVVASDIGGIPEWLDHGETGLLVRPGDKTAFAEALVTLLRDEDTAEAMGLEGWRRVERFSPRAHLDSLVGIYARAVSSGNENLTRGAA